MAEIVVHHLEHSRSLRLLWLLEEVGVDYEVVRYARTRGFRAPPELQAVHPLGRAPLLTIGDEVLAESGAIFEAVLDRFGEGRFRPDPGAPTYSDYRYWLHYAEGSLPAPLIAKLVAVRVARAPVPFFMKPLVRRIGRQIEAGYAGPELALHGGYLDAHLDGREWFVGSSFTAVDILMSYPLGAGVERAGWGTCAHIVGWLERGRARPAWERAVARGGGA